MTAFILDTKVEAKQEEEINKLARAWIELLINGILEDCSNPFPVVLEKKSIDNFNREL